MASAYAGYRFSIPRGPVIFCSSRCMIISPMTEESVDFVAKGCRVGLTKVY